MDTKADFAADKNLIFISLIALVIGAVCAYIAKALLILIYFFTNLFYFQRVSIQSVSPTNNHLGVYAILIPALGGLIIGLMARFGSEKIRGHGIPEALEAILFGKSKMSPKVAVLKPLSSAISIGSGGPFGAEGPIIMTGGAFGSLIAQLFRLTSSERKTLLVAGAAAGMSATFASPMAAVLLAVELLLFEWKPRSLIPVAVASCVAAVMRTSLFGAGPLFPVTPHSAPGADVILCAALVGLVAGCISTGLSWLVYTFEDLFLKLPIHWMWWPVIGGLAVGIGGYFQPRALGVGYDIISDLLNGNILPQIVLGLILVKGFIWAFSLGSGTSGGVLAPLLIMGGGLGSLAAAYLPNPSISFWPMVSMAAVLGGMMRSPFTGTIFALELTHDVESLLPLLVASVMGHAFTVLMMKRSILTEKVARRGFHIFREYSVDVLERIHADEVMTTEVETVSTEYSVSEVLEKYFGANQKHLSYPVMDKNRNLAGLISKADLMNSKREQKLREVLPQSFAYVTPKVSCREVTEIMAERKISRIMVVDSNDARKLVGFITLHDLLKPRILEMMEEKEREANINFSQALKFGGQE